MPPARHLLRRRSQAAKSSTDPAPPLAITGTELSSRIAAISSRSNPWLVPSASIELTSNSPTPRSIASVAQSRASSSVSTRPPCVVTTNPEPVPAAFPGPVPARFTSRLSTSTWAPNRSAISSMQFGARDRRAVDADLVGAAGQQPRDILGTAHSPADRQRDEHLLSRCGHDVVDRSRGHPPSP